MLCEFLVPVCPVEYSHITLLPRPPAVASSVEKFAFAQGQITWGQRCRVIAREVFHALLQVAQRLFTDGRSCAQVVEVLMPA
jgi:hypothetical protein